VHQAQGAVRRSGATPSPQRAKSLQSAPGRAKAILGSVAHGNDPAGQKSTERGVPTVAELAPAHRSSVSVDCFGESKGVGYRLLEHRMQNFNHEFHRSIIVVVKDYLKVAGLGLNIGHRIVPPDWCHFGVSCRIVGRG
jgi:hypothetical protein